MENKIKLPPEIERVRDELSLNEDTEAQMCTLQNGWKPRAESVKPGFYAAAEFEKLQAQLDASIKKEESCMQHNTSLRKDFCDLTESYEKLQARNDKLVEALKASCRCLGSIDEVKCSACQALSANAQAPQNAVGDNG